MTDHEEQIQRFVAAPGRRGYLWRHRDPSGVSGTDHVADVVVLPDGSALVRWLPLRRGGSIVSMPNEAEILGVSGHGGATELLWPDQWHFATEAPADVDPDWVWRSTVPGGDTYTLGEGSDIAWMMIQDADDPHDAEEHECLGPAQIPEHLQPGAKIALRAWMDEHRPEPGTDVYLWTDYRTPEMPPQPKAQPKALPQGTVAATDEEMREVANALDTIARLAHRAAKRLGPDSSCYDQLVRTNTIGTFVLRNVIDGHFPPSTPRPCGPDFSNEGEP